MDLTEFIALRARELGFDGVGVAQAMPFPEEGERHFTDWLRQGYHGDMAYLERSKAKRLAPATALDGARSIISLAINYNPGDVAFSHGRGSARISRYALGEDYHRVIPEKLEQLWQSVREESNRPLHGKLFCDTGPLMEKVHAERAGIGWIGKHGILVTKEFGSWVFLGEIVIDIPLRYDQPSENLCSSCSLCIQSCPTGAIVSPGVIDATRCISYQTVENRNAIPTTIRSMLENWVFGCDCCQEACPYNSSVPHTEEQAFLPKPELISAPLEMLFAVSANRFAESFQNSAIIRAQRDGFLRNIIVAMGNSGEKRFIPLLRNTSSSSNPILREHAEWAIATIRGSE